MQPWSGSGQSGAGGQNSWQQSFTYGGQDEQFDPNQSWSQAVTDQPGSFSQINNTQDTHAQSFFHPAAQGDSFLGANLHHAQAGDATFPGSHSALVLNQQFTQGGQDVIDPAFSSLHPDIYSQQAKGSLNIDQATSHPPPHAQGLTQHEYPFSAHNGHSFNPAASQYSPNQLLPRSSSQHNHSSVPHFDTLPGSFQADQPFSHDPQHSPPASHQQPFSHGQTFVQNVNDQPNQFSADSHAHIAFHQPQPTQQQQQQQQHHQRSQQSSTQDFQSLDPANFSPVKPAAYSHPARDGPVPHQPQLQSISLPPGQPTAPASHESLIAAHAAHDSRFGLEVSSEPPAPKKRKRAVRSVPAIPVVDTPPPVIADLSVESSVKKFDDTDSLPVPEPTAEETKLIAGFGKRNKAAQAKYPSIKGLPHLVFDGTAKLPAPKSYDKLAPLIALPPKSCRPVVPELGYSLPCEVQGRFSSSYRPSPEKSGLDERRAEAKPLLDEYDKSMRELGKRQPKYTEYPHAFKEQLKSDEATKNKAEKKAKKELEDRHKPIRPATRPDDPVEAAVWDTIGIVHIDQATPRTTSLIAGRVQQAGEFFVKLRTDMNRSKVDLDQAMANKQPEDVIAVKRSNAEQKKEALYRALDATVEHADDAVLDNLGGHQKLVLSLVNALITCIKAGDFSGKLPKIVLELFTHFRMTKKIVETTNFDAVRKRYEDKGDNEVKDLVQEISAKIKKFHKANEPETTTGYTGTSAASRAKSGAKAVSDHTSAKRGRDDDVDTRTVKKIAVEAGSGSLSKKLGQTKTSSQLATKASTSKQATSSILPGKTRPVAKTVAKTEPLGADSPNASADDKIKSDTRKTPVKPDTKPASSSSNALSGIASLLDSINAKKPEVASTVSKELTTSDTSETPDQRAKRLRKEARRKLRVSWKPEEELVQVKIFQKDDQEDEGRDSNMIRDAADDRSEGMVLKQRVDVDEDDDDDDIPYQPWVNPRPTDFSHLPNDVRDKSYVTRGGSLRFTTEEQRSIADREQRELMAIYTDVDDIPPTPKSPPPESTSQSESRAGYLPNDDAKFEEVQLRWRDEQNIGPEHALGAALRRLEAKHNPSNKLDSIFGRLKGASTQLNSQQSSTLQHLPMHNSLLAPHNFPFAAGPTCEAQVYACLHSDKIRTWQDPNPIHVDFNRLHQYGDANLKMIGNHIETVARSLAGKPYPARAPPEWLAHDKEQVREWWLGYNKEVAAVQRKLDEERARAEAEDNARKLVAGAGANGQTTGQTQGWNAYYQQQQSYAPYLALLQQMTGGQASTAGTGQAPPATQQIPDSQLQSILAAINQPQQQQQQASQPSNPLANLNPNDPTYQQLLMLTQMTQGQQHQGHPPPPPPPPPAAAHQSSERDWDRGDSRDGKDSRKKKPTLAPHKPANKALIGTKACSFWQQGKCARGDKCTFRHD